MDKSLRTTIYNTVVQCRRLLEQDLAQQLEGTYGVHADGAFEPLGSLTHPDAVGRADRGAIAAHLNRDKRELMKTLIDTVDRRNDIVHRADRLQTDPGGEAQDIAFAWTQQAVDTIKHVCLALDELVAARVAQLEAMISA
jgi:hypothetical protein